MNHNVSLQYGVAIFLVLTQFRGISRETVLPFVNPLANNSRASVETGATPGLFFEAHHLPNAGLSFFVGLILEDLGRRILSPVQAIRELTRKERESLSHRTCGTTEYNEHARQHGMRACT